MNRLYLFLAIIAGGLLLLIVNHDSGQTFGMSNDNFGEVIYLLPIAALLGAGILASRERLGQNLRFLAIWVLIGLGLVAVYVYRGDARQVGAMIAAEFMPGSPFVLTTVDGREEIVIRKRMNGHFVVNASIDGKRLPMLVDTGASRIALSYRDAGNLGFDPASLTFDQDILTANGPMKSASITIPEVTIGPITRRNISASVAPEGALGESLLGMNFLSTLSSIRMEPDEMRLTD